MVRLIATMDHVNGMGKPERKNIVFQNIFHPLPGGVKFPTSRIE
jgi:hypothetical protein